MLDRVSSTPQRVRTLFLSDIHLGTRGCQAEKLLDLLRHYEADTIYLVGDIVDGWQLKSAWYWPQIHNDVVQKLLRQARKGVRLLYIPGTMTSSCATTTVPISGGIEVLGRHPRRRDGERYLVIHGDLFDGSFATRAGSRSWAAMPTISRFGSTPISIESDGPRA
jgi:UDP-2,3-diacylglucosamine pyrophosphatase LpxH